MVPTFAAGSFFADRYRIVGLLGSGAMGRVYSAVEIHGDRKVALKVLHAERGAEVETVERFKREGNVLASVGHPCIVEVYAFHRTDKGLPYLAMELLEGLTLKTRLQNGGRFEDPAELQEIIDGLASALEAAHDVGVIHRDLKPDNIFLPATGSPRVKIVDFGLSRVIRPDKNLTQSGMIIGTPRYMAPEQIKDARTIGLTSDLYSLGVVTYECLSGKSPYPAEDYGQLLGCLLEGRSVPFVTARPDLPQFDSFMARALAQDPAERYQSGGAFADAYAEALGRPSQRDKFEKAASKSRPARPRSKSHAGMIPSKASTLAWDASAAREAMAQLEAGPPPGMQVDPEALEAQAELKAQVDERPQAGPPAASPWPQTAGELFSDESTTKPLPQKPSQPAPPIVQRQIRVSPVSVPAVSATAPTGMQAQVTPEQIAAAGGIPRTPSPMTPAPYTPAPHTPAPLPTAPANYVSPSNAPPPMAPASQAPPPQVQAQGGDTLYLGDASQIPGYPPPPAGHAPPSSPSMVTSSPMAPMAPVPQSPTTGATPRKKRSWGLIIFFIALLLVVVLSALGGFALRESMRSTHSTAASTESSAAE